MAGKVYVYSEDNTSIDALLYNFDVGSTYLKPQHKAWLDQHVVAKFQNSGTVLVTTTGFASWSGNLEWNRNVAEWRAYRVLGYLWDRGLRYNLVFSGGQVDDDTDDDPNDEDWRSVELSVTSP
jgi:outer membrane protein OmpA-like peptidoglycan-associated protein